MKLATARRTSLSGVSSSSTAIATRSFAREGSTRTTRRVWSPSLTTRSAASSAAQGAAVRGSRRHVNRAHRLSARRQGEDRGRE